MSAIRSRAIVALAFLLLGCSRPQPKIAVATPAVWESLPTGMNGEFSDIWFADTLNGWIVGGSYQYESGLVGRTRDGGKTWQYTSGLVLPDKGAFRVHLNAVRFHDAHHGVTVGTAGKILLTDDGGENWRLVRDGSLTDHLSDVDFVDRWTGWAVGLGGVLRTRDGGETWERAMRSSYEDDARPSGNAIEFLDSWRGWLVGSGGRIMRTTDGGESWTRVQTALAKDERPDLYDLCFVGRDLGWAVGQEGTILHSADGGLTWARQDPAVEGARSKPVRERIERRPGVVEEYDLGGRTPGLTLTSVTFLDGRQGWVTGHFGYEARSIVLHTEDGGATWNVEADVKGEELRALFMLATGRGWAVGDRIREGRQVLLQHAALTP